MSAFSITYIKSRRIIDWQVQNDSAVLANLDKVCSNSVWVRDNL
jgi:hypothetical protein